MRRQDLHSSDFQIDAIKPLSVSQRNTQHILNRALGKHGNIITFPNAVLFKTVISSMSFSPRLEGGGRADGTTFPRMQLSSRWLSGMSGTVVLRGDNNPWLPTCIWSLNLGVGKAQSRGMLGSATGSFPGLPPRRVSLFFFSGLQFPVGCAREGGRVLLPEVRFYAWVPQQLPEPEPHRSRGTGAAGVRTGVAMVTRERLRWGRAKGGSTCRYSRLGGILTSRPCCGAMVWAGRGLSGLGPIKGRRRRQLGVVLGASVYWGSRG